MVESEGGGTPTEKQTLLEDGNGAKSQGANDNDAAPREGGTRHASASHAFVNLIKSFVGAGLLALPHAMSEVGWLGGILALAAVGLVSSFTGRLLIKAKRISKAATYPDVGYAAAGRAGSSLTFALLCLQQTMMAASYMMYVRPHVLPNKWANAALVCAAVLPFTFIRDMDALFPISVAGSLCLVAGALTVLIGAEWHPPVFFNTFNAAALPLFMGSAIFSMEGENLLIPVEGSMRNPREFMPVLFTVYTVVVSFLAVFAMVFWAAFGKVEAVLSDSFPSNGAGTVAAVLLDLYILCTYPLALFPVSELADGLGAPVPVSRVLLVLLTGAIAASVNNFGPFGAFIGYACTAFQGFILPAAYFLRLEANPSKEDRYGAWAVVVLGILFVAVGVTATLNDMTSGRQH